jgi:GT2 family glycosyltransferase
MPISAAPRLISGSLPPARRYAADIIILSQGRLQATLDAVASAIRQANVDSYVALLDQGTDCFARARYTEIFAGSTCAGYFGSDTNLGVGGGRNFLAQIGHGDIIVALDNDAVFADPFIAADALRAFATTPNLGAVAFRIMDSSGQQLDERSWGFPQSLKPLAYKKFLTTTFVGAGHAIRRAAWEDAGGYDASLFFTWEEYDFSLRAIARGWHIEYRGDLAVLHKLAPESRIRWQAGRTKFYVRNRLIIARKWRASWPSLLPRIAGYAVKGALNGAALAALAGTFAAIRRDRHTPRETMPPAMRRYLADHDQAHRGKFLDRIGPEIFSKLARD